jgi:hypothetical protein
MFFNETSEILNSVINIDNIYIKVVDILCLIFEFLLGLILIIRYRLVLFLKITIATLLFFLIINFLRLLNSVSNNCACFGEVLEIKIPESIVIDIILCTMTLILLKRTESGREVATD